MKFQLLILSLIASSFCHPSVLVAYWPPDGVDLCTAPNFQGGCRIVRDATQGAIVVWTDLRSGTYYDIFGQRITGSGVVQWATDGVALCKAPRHQGVEGAVSDGAGGVIVTWTDDRAVFHTDVYAQRISPSGLELWAEDGVALSTSTTSQGGSRLVSDGQGGAIVTWVENNNDIFAQRIDASGVVRWTASGAEICTILGNQQHPEIVSDDAGGAIITWRDDRNAPTAYYDIYAQRIDATGAVQWTTNGVALCTSVDTQDEPVITTDEAGGAIVAWRDRRQLFHTDVYVQRISVTGQVSWLADGVAVCSAANDQYEPKIASDGAGGAIVAWVDGRSGNVAEPYAQRINASGTVQWASDGVALGGAADLFSDAAIASDGAGGAILTWRDVRAADRDIYAQRISSLGAILWTTGGVAVCTADENQAEPCIATDDAGGAIVAWGDLRNDNADVYAQRIAPDGSIATGIHDIPTSLAITITNFPNPFSSATELDIWLQSDAAVDVEIFDVGGRRVRAIDFGRMKAGLRQIHFDGRGDDGNVLPSGVYFCRVHAGAQAMSRKLVIAH